MKLLIVYHCGLSEDVRSIFREYARQGIDLSVIVPSEVSIDKTNSISGYFKYSDKCNEKGYRFIPVDLRKPSSYGEGFKFFQLFHTIKRLKPDIIHVFDEYVSFYLAQTILCRNILYSRKVPVIAHVFQNIPFNQFKLPPLVFKSLGRFFKRILRIIQYFSMFVFQKRYLDGATGGNIQALENVRALGVNIPLRLIFWGVDFSVFRPKNRKLCREKLGIPENIKLVGYFGKIIKEKGVDKLVKAVSKISNCHLMLIGSGNYKDELDKIIDFLGIRDRVYWYDYISHNKLADYYNCLDVFVLPTQTTPTCREQYGRVLVEAMACQIPVIGSSSGAIPKVLEGYPKHLIFKEDSVDDLINKINKIEELKFPKDFDINKFLHKFSVENFAAEHIKFFKQLLK